MTTALFLTCVAFMILTFALCISASRESQDQERINQLRREALDKIERHSGIRRDDLPPGSETPKTNA